MLEGIPAPAAIQHRLDLDAPGLQLPADGIPSDIVLKVLDAMEAADRVVQDPLPVGGLGAARGHLIEDLRGLGNPDHRAL